MRVIHYILFRHGVLNFYDNRTCVIRYILYIDSLSSIFCYLFSLSKVAAEKMVNGNPYITDLSDRNRPMKLTEKFNSLYDNYWTDAYEILVLNNTDERTVCQQLLLIMQVCLLDTKHFILRTNQYGVGSRPAL